MRQIVSLWSIARHTAVFAAAAAFFGAWTADDAQAQRRGEAFLIECPADEVRAEIVIEGLDEAWRAPRNRGRLVDTRVRENRRGRILLECGYELFGRTIWVRTRQPEEALECEATRDGFDCFRPRPRRRGPEVGEITLRENDQFDFDTGLRGSGSNDIFIQRRGSIRRALTTLGDARIGVFGVEEPTRRDCARTQLSPQRIDVRQLRPGTFFCFETDQGRLGYFLVRGVRQQLLRETRVNLGYVIFRRRN